MGDLTIILAYIFGLLLLLIIGKVLFVPLKIIIRLLYNGLIGGLALWIFNILGAYIGLTIAINPITALIAGFFGLPGIVLLIAIRYFIA